MSEGEPEGEQVVDWEGRGCFHLDCTRSLEKRVPNKEAQTWRRVFIRPRRPEA